MATEPMGRESTDDAGGFAGSMVDAVRGITDNARVDRVYGDPITVNGRVIVPVARVRYGFGLGFGSGTDPTGDPTTDGESTGATGEGGGGGGGMSATPIGFLEIADDRAQFVPFSRWSRVTLAVAAGVLVGALLGRRGLRRDRS